MPTAAMVVMVTAMVMMTVTPAVVMVVARWVMVVVIARRAVGRLSVINGRRMAVVHRRWLRIVDASLVVAIVYDNRAADHLGAGHAGTQHAAEQQ